jgi:FkbM family methyltransferase
MKYHSQLGQDSIARQFFDKKGITNGFFLDVGALDGKNFSNTYIFETLGWHGICIEGHPDYFDFLLKNRPNSKCYSCAVGGLDEGSVNFIADAAGCFSTINPEAKFLEKRRELAKGKDAVEGFTNSTIQVPIRTINSILEENNIKDIDFISIDIDGSERYALPEFNLSELNWKLMCVEYKIVPDVIELFQKKHNLRYFHDLKWDRLFVKEQKDLELLRNLKVIGTQSIFPHPMKDWKGLSR